MKNRSCSIPDKLPSISSNLKIKHNRKKGLSLSVKSPILMSLYIENSELREKLKDLNENLNRILTSGSQKKEARNKYEGIEINDEQTLEALWKKIRTYELEYRKLECRMNQIIDPEYEKSLKLRIQGMNKKVSFYEENSRKLIAMQKEREKKLESVLETGEFETVFKEFSGAKSEIEIFSKKNGKLEIESERAYRSMKDLDRKIKESEEEYEELQNSVGETKEIDRQAIENFEKLKRILDMVLFEYESRSRLLNSKIKKLKDELNKEREVENSIYQKLNILESESKGSQSVIKGLKKSSSYYYRKILNDEYVTNDFFIKNK